MDKVFIEDIRVGDGVGSSFLLADVRLGTTKAGKPFVGLKLKDRSGEIEGRIWDRAELFFEAFKVGDIVDVDAVAESFQGQTQLKVSGWRGVDPAAVDLSLFVPAASRGMEEMFADLRGICDTIRDPDFAGLAADVLNDEALMNVFKRSPAAKRFHHAYVGGLLEHTLSIMRSVEAVCPLYPFLNRDLLLAGTLLHDMGKTREFDQGPAGDYTSEGRLLGHIIICLEMIDEKVAARPGFPTDKAMLLKHLVISHHGENEMGSPKRPKILEGMVLHLLDDLDAKMNGIGGFIERHVDPETGWTGYNRLMERYFHRPSIEVYGPPEEETSGEAPVEEAKAAEAAPPEASESAQPVGRKRRRSEEPKDPDPDQLSFLEG